MRALIQRAVNSSVSIMTDGEYKLKSSIDKGFVILLGVSNEDTEQDLQKLADKISKLRIFEDENGKMNLSIKDIDGKILLISQFTLYADCKKGNRPSFINAGKPDYANLMYEKFADYLRNLGFEVGTGEFGADMLVNIQNVGPTTIWLDSGDLNR